MHWTYASPADDGDLAQGDVLEPTPELKALLREIHPHFAKPKYVAFCVVTQSCDLVRRGAGNACGARYIAIAPIRPLTAVAPRLLKQVAVPVDSVVEGIFRSASKGRAKEMLNRFFNQNENALGLFYYHPNPEAGIGESSVAFLRVSVSLKAEHYNTLIAARRLSLTAEFQAKFGWLVGNLYSRAATTDWTEGRDRQKELERLVAEYVEKKSSETGPLWIDDSIVDAAFAKGVDLGGLSAQQAKVALEQHKPPPKADVLADAALEVLSQFLAEQDPPIRLSDEQARKLKHRLRQDSRIKGVLR